MKFRNKIYLCSFMSPGLEKYGEKFLTMARGLKIYNDIKIYTRSDLSSKIKKKIDYYINNGDLKGYGYYLWKPFIINNFAKKLPSNSVIQYLDLGFEINHNGKKKLYNYIKLCKKKKFLNFKYKHSNKKEFAKYKQQILFENQYTKRKIWTKFKLKPSHEYMKSEQILSGNFFFYNNTRSKYLLKLWEKLANKNKLIDNSVSNLKEIDVFIENRHDQSIFSLLCKKFKTYQLPACEVEFCYKKGKKTWEHLKNYPFLAKRNLKYSLKHRVINKVFYIKKKLLNANFIKI